MCLRSQAAETLAHWNASVTFRKLKRHGSYIALTSADENYAT